MMSGDGLVDSVSAFLSKGTDKRACRRRSTADIGSARGKTGPSTHQIPGGKGRLF